MMTSEQWITQLQAFALTQREIEPPPVRRSFSPLEEMQCRIVGGHLISWLEKWGPGLITERNLLSDMKGWDKNPHIVFLTKGPGLAAAREILNTNARITWLTRDQFDKFLSDHPDREMIRHCVLESWFLPATPEQEKRALQEYSERGPFEAGNFWIHHDVSLMAPLFARGGCHLWYRQGDDLSMIEEGFESWIS